MRNDSMGSHAKASGQRPEAGAEGGERSIARIDAKVRAHLGDKLKATYQSLVEEPVPDRFTKLLEELSRSEGKSES